MIDLRKQVQSRLDEDKKRQLQLRTALLKNDPKTQGIPLLFQGSEYQQQKPYIHPEEQERKEILNTILENGGNMGRPPKPGYPYQPSSQARKGPKTQPQ